MTKNPRTILTASMLLAVACGPQTTPTSPADEVVVQALNLDLKSPYGDADVRAVLGNVLSSDGLVHPWLVYIRVLDDHCTWNLLSETTTLTADVSFAGGNGGDSMEIVAPSWPKTVHCSNLGLSWDMTAPDQAGHVIQAYGGKGNDTMICTGNAEVTCSGDEGNDGIYGFFNPNVLLMGGPGNDYLYAQVWDSTTLMDGGNDDDCLEPPAGFTPGPLTYSCGWGTGDRSVGVAWPGCESVVTTCD